jgi:NAD+ synthase (glutamine-hydrolysing)
VGESCRIASLPIVSCTDSVRYGCSDHFLESDTVLHCWESIAKILTHPDCRDILIDLGSPVVHVRQSLACLEYHI